MNIKKFQVLAHDHNIVPVYRRITADMLTPVLAFLKIREEAAFSFLLESVEGIGRLARYSFLGKKPSKLIAGKGRHVEVTCNGKTETLQQNLFDYLQSEISLFNSPHDDQLPDFTGGIVGFLGYENIELIEDVVRFRREEEIDTPDALFALYKNIFAFDHYKHQLLLITNVFIDEFPDTERAYSAAMKQLDSMESDLHRKVIHESEFSCRIGSQDEDAADRFCQMVDQAKQNIFEGDVFQIVLSRRFSAEYQGDLFDVYRALRMINPSPYMYFLEYDAGFTIIGTSPEDLLKVKDRKATILPIAGTRPRGKNQEEDTAHETALINDPKERAEHVMLVDLARNDLGRISEYGSVKVTENMKIQHYSHVMHIVSRVEGKLQEGYDCVDALKASFPAGTLTGAPKIRAIQLIDSYERGTRNVYGGAVGYLDFRGNLDMCIAIRTLFAKNGIIYWQAGAGIVADSVPQNELDEIKNKSQVLVSALEFAEKIDENTGY